MAAYLRDHPHHAPRRAGDGNDDFIHAAGIENAPQIFEFANHRHAVNFVSLLLGVVIQKAKGENVQLARLLHFPRDQRARVPRADNQHPPRFFLIAQRRLLRQNPHGEARPADKNERKQPVNAQRGTRHPRLHRAEGEEREHHAARQQRRGGDRRRDEFQFVYAGIRPPAAVQPEEIIDGKFDDDGDDHHQQRGGEVKRNFAQIQAQRKTAQHAQQRERRVDEQNVSVANKKIAFQRFIHAAVFRSPSSKEISARKPRSFSASAGEPTER